MRVSDFDALRSRRHDHDVTLMAFDLIEWQGDDLRDKSLEQRKQRLAKMLARDYAGITYNEHLAHEGAAVFEHACRLGLEGIVSKRIDSLYRSGSSKVWLKSKNPQCEAVRRERDEDWN
jgi:ATP-dependent DNA ligase